VFKEKKNKKDLLNIFTNYSDKTSITYKDKNLTYKKILSHIIDINNFLKKKKFQNKTIIIQFENRFLTLLFFLSAIFSKTTICPLDPNLPSYRLNKIKKNLKASKVLKKFKLSDKFFYDTSSLNFKNHEFLITFSSGTSGNPKGIIHSTNSILGSSFSYGKLMKLNKKSKLLHCLPEFYMAGIVNTFLTCIWKTSQIFIVDSFSKKSIFNIWDDILKFQINVVYLVPSIYSMISNFNPLKSKEIVKKYKINFFSTSNNLYPNIRKTFFRKFNTRIKSCYGITEMGGPLTNEKSGNLTRDSAGQLIDGCKVKVKIENGKKLLLFKSNYSCKYLIISGKKKKIQLDKNGYFNSQDTGYLRNQQLILTGRVRDILKKGGELIQLKDIENIILDCPFVMEAAAIGIKDELSDEKLYLYILIDSKASLAKKIKFLLSIIEKKMYKTEKPDKIIILKKMPKTLSGKIIKRQLLKINAKNKIREIIL